MKVKIKNGRIIDPASGEDQIRDLFIADGAIVDPHKAGHEFLVDSEIDATDQIVCPGLTGRKACSWHIARHDRIDAGVRPGTSPLFLVL